MRAHRYSVFDVSGKIALVTGASSGIGVHFSKLLAANGAKVVVAARRVDRLTALVREIEEKGGTALATVMDVTDSASVSAAFDAAEKTFGVVDIVSNNAGVGGGGKVAFDIDEQLWDTIIDTNLKGVWLVAKESGARMIAAGKPGSIVNTASILGLRVSRTASSYAASKAAVVQLTKSLALEWSREGVRVNALCPGYFKTELTEEFFASERFRELIGNSPAGRSGNMEELSAPFMLLASEAGSFINGVALPVDGAHSIGNM